MEWAHERAQMNEFYSTKIMVKPSFDFSGVAHEYGLGVPKDQRRAAEWHSLAAAQGLADSDYHLGLMKAQGRGFSQDLTGAAIHFQKAGFPKTCGVLIRHMLY